MTHSDEKWLPIKGYDGSYEVSSFGRVKSLNRIILTKCGRSRSYPIKVKESIIRGTISPFGYNRITLYKDKKPKSFFAHRLVMLSFVGKSKLQVNHKNGLKADNRLENLEYCTSSENHIHAFKTGLRFVKKGQDNLNSKLNNSDVFKIRQKLKQGIGGTEISREFKVSPQLICDIKFGRRWNHI